MDRGEVIHWDNVCREKKNTGTRSLVERDQTNTKNLLNPARASKAGMGNSNMGNNRHFKVKKGMEFQNTTQWNKRTEVEKQILE